MNYKIKTTLISGIGMLCLNMFCMQEPRLAIAQTNLNVLQNKFGRNLVNKDANKVVVTVAKGDTFEIITQRRDDPATDYFTYYKVKTKTNVKGFLFEKDSFTVIEN